MGFNPSADLGTTNAGSGGVFDVNGMEMEFQAWRVRCAEGGQRSGASAFPCFCRMGGLVYDSDDDVFGHAAYVCVRDTCQLQPL